MATYRIQANTTWSLNSDGVEVRSSTLLGTEWVAAGEGATGSELATASDEYCDAHPDSAHTGEEWTQILSTASQLYAGPLCFLRTNLRLTGHPLTPTDLARIAACEVSK